MTRKSPKNQKPGGRKPLTSRGIPQRERRGDPVEGKGGGPRPGKRPSPADSKRPEKIGDRIAKVIARAGLGSRREAETWIAEGRVAINGAVIASPAVNVTPHDKVMVDGKPLPARERTRLFLFHKPRGLVTTSADPEGRPTIFGGLPKNLPRLISVGRLDLNTEGLLLLTNDGGLARVLELPETGWLRRYRVRAHGKVTQSALDALRDGIEVEGVRYGPIEASLEREQGSNNWLTFAMREGKNREIRNVLGALGLQVNRLIRVSFGPFQLGELADGAIEEVKTRTLRDQIGERLAAEAEADFAAPAIEREAPAPRARPEPQRPVGGPRPDKRRSGERQDERPPRSDPKGGAAHRKHERKPGPRDAHVRPRAPAHERSAGPKHRRDEAPRAARPARPARPGKGGAGQRKDDGKVARGGHVWRDRAPAHDGSPGHKAKYKHQKAAPRRPGAGVIADRKGRQVVVERAGSDKPERPDRRPRGGKWRER